MENNEHIAPVSVCGVRVQTAEGVNIPCRLPRPCKDHEPVNDSKKDWKPEDDTSKRDWNDHRGPLHEPKVCGVETNWTEFAPQRFCQNTKPCPLHDKPKEYRCPNGYSSTDCIRHCYEQHPQQEEESWENQFDRTFYWEIYKRGDIKSFIRTEIAQAEKRGYEAGQMVGQIEMGKWVLYTNTGGRSGIHSKIDAIAESLKAKTDI